MGNINIEIPSEVHKRLKIASAVNSIAIKQYIIQALEEAMQKRGKHDKSKH